MGKLADALQQVPVAQQPEWKPKAVFDGTTGYVETGTVAEPPREYTDLLRQFDLDPDEVEIVGTPRVSKWQSASGEWLSSYRFNLAAKTAASTVDMDDIRAYAQDATPNTAPAVSGDRVFVFQASDLQVGKIDGDGIEGTIARYTASVQRACAKLTATPDIAAVHLVFAGDCIENGGVSQGGKLAWRQSLTITEQVRVWRRLLMFTVREFAPLTRELVVTVVGGNHDDATRSPVQTRADDNWATEGAIAVHDTIQENPDAFSHVTIQVPPKDQGYVTVKVKNTVFTVLHGHQFRKGKAAEWLASQAFYQGAPAGADFLLYGHWHTLSVAQDGPRTLICSPTYDGGSSWFREMTGAESRQGGLSYITDGPEFEGLSRV